MHLVPTSVVHFIRGTENFYSGLVSQLFEVVYDTIIWVKLKSFNPIYKAATVHF